MYHYNSFANHLTYSILVTYSSNIVLKVVVLNIRIIFLVTLFHLLVLPLNTFSQALILSPEEREYLINNPEIGLVGPAHIQPYIIQNNDKRFSGIVPDYLESISKLLNTKIFIKEIAPTGKHFEIATSKDFYGVAITLNAEQVKKQFFLTKPYFHTPYTVFTNTNSAFPISSEKDLSGKRVAVLKNHFGE